LFELKNAKENLELHHGLRGTGWPKKSFVCHQKLANFLLPNFCCTN